VEGYGHNNNNFLQHHHHHHHNSVVEAKKCFKYAKDTKIKHLVSHVKGFLLLFFYFIYLFLLNIAAAVKRFLKQQHQHFDEDFFLYKFFKTSTFPLLNYWYEKIFSAKCFAIFFFSSCCCCYFFRGGRTEISNSKMRGNFFSSFCDSFTTTMVVYDAEELDRFLLWANCVSSMCVLMMMLLLLLLCTAIFWRFLLQSNMYDEI